MFAAVGVAAWLEPGCTGLRQGRGSGSLALSLEAGAQQGPGARPSWVSCQEGGRAQGRVTTEAELLQ